MQNTKTSMRSQQKVIFSLLMYPHSKQLINNAIYGLQSSMSVQLFKELCQKRHNTMTKQTSCPHVKGSER